MKITEMDKKLKAARKKLEKLYVEIPECKKDLADDLISNISFMQVQLEVLRGQILEHGMVSVYDNGKIQQDVVSPYCKAYSQIHPKYIQAVQTLNKLLPSNTEYPISDDLTEFTPTGK